MQRTVLTAILLTPEGSVGLLYVFYSVGPYLRVLLVVFWFGYGSEACDMTTA